MIKKSQDAYRTISEAAAEVSLPTHVLRFWESKFFQIKPMKRAGGRRFYRKQDIRLLFALKQLLYTDGYTIKGAQKYLKEFGVSHIIEQYGSCGAEITEKSAEPMPSATPDPSDRSSLQDPSDNEPNPVYLTEKERVLRAIYQQVRDAHDKLNLVIGS